MVNDLGLNPTDVSCLSENLCLFAGDVSPPDPGEEIPAVAVSIGPFTPHGSVVGTTTTFPPNSDTTESFVACPGPTLCVVSSVDGIYVTRDPTASQWVREVAPSAEYSFGQVSCPTVSFCAVATGSGVLVSGSPSGGSSAWSYIRLGLLGLGPSPVLRPRSALRAEAATLKSVAGSKPRPTLSLRRVGMEVERSLRPSRSTAVNTA